MPHACIFQLDTSPRMVSPHDAFSSYQVNANANDNNIAGDAANDLCIIIDPSYGQAASYFEAFDVTWFRYDALSPCAGT